MHERPSGVHGAVGFTLVAAAALASCTGGAAPPPGPPVDAEQEALRAAQEGRLGGPVRIVFDWSLSEPDLRVGGRGVARVEPPFRARLDLFTDNGEQVVRAALVDDELRIPPGSRAELIPPPALFWGALGIYRPGTGTALLGGERQGDGVRLSFAVSQEERLMIELSGRLVRRVERLVDGHVVERVTVERGEQESEGDRIFPGSATYRHMADFRELKLTLASLEHVEPYPPDIWDPIR